MNMNMSNFFRLVLGALTYLVYSGFVYDGFQLNIPRLFGNSYSLLNVPEALYYDHYIFHFITLIFSAIVGAYLAGIVSRTMGGIVSVISSVITIAFIIYNSKNFLNSEHLGYLISFSLSVPLFIYLSYIFGKIGEEESNSDKTFYGVKEIHLLWIFLPLSFYLASLVPIFIQAFGSWFMMGLSSSSSGPLFLYRFLNFGEWTYGIISMIIHLGTMYLMWLMFSSTHMLLSGHFLQDKSRFLKSMFLFGTIVLGSLFWFLVALILYTP